MPAIYYAGVKNARRARWPRVAAALPADAKTYNAKRLAVQRPNDQFRARRKNVEYRRQVVRDERHYADALVHDVAQQAESTLGGLITLSLIHYARWLIIGRNQFPRRGA